MKLIAPIAARSKDVAFLVTISAAGVSPAEQVTILDVLDQTASVKLVAEWGVDYMRLAKFDGKWMIVKVLWQSPPKKSAAQKQ